MTDRKTIKLPAAEYNRHNQRRKDRGLSWAEYIDGQAPEFDTLDRDDVREVVRDELDRALADYATY